MPAPEVQALDTTSDPLPVTCNDRALSESNEVEAGGREATPGATEDELYATRQPTRVGASDGGPVPLLCDARCPDTITERSIAAANQSREKPEMFDDVWRSRPDVDDLCSALRPLSNFSLRLCRPRVAQLAHEHS
ncbi:unnamed protein product [Lampetra fluviatilis]